MNTAERTTNKHFTPSFRYDAQPNLSDQVSQQNSYNIFLTQQRDLDRYKTVYSSKLLIHDYSRTVEPSNYYGVKFHKEKDKTVRYCPAGMFGQNSTRQTGLAFTTPAPKMYAQNTGFSTNG
jgi:hypothetical protein